MTNLSVKEKIQQLLLTDAYSPSDAVFPEIDANRIAADLRLEKAAQKAGRGDLPKTEAVSFDGLEMQIIDRVDELRRKGLESYQDHFRVYNERLAKAGNARSFVAVAAGNARTDFLSAVKALRQKLVPEREHVRDAAAGLAAFRRHNRLYRAAQTDYTMPAFWSAFAVFLLLETLLNGFLFAQKNEFGLLGGAVVAILVSLVNVSWSSLAGWNLRSINHISWLRKAQAVAVLAVWVAVAAVFNLAVAHFRDAVLVTDDWILAGERALAAFKIAPAGLGNIESWLLVALGALISLIALIKAYRHGDPYPGYSALTLQLDEARRIYSDEVSDGIEQMIVHRDTAVSELEEARDQVDRALGEAVDALYGQHSLAAHCQSFLGQCETRVNLLLTKYQEANTAARKTEAPAYFGKPYAFPPFEPGVADDGRKIDAEGEKDRVRDEVGAAITQLYEECAAAIEQFQDIDDIEGHSREPAQSNEGGEAGKQPDGSSGEHGVSGKNLHLVGEAQGH